MSIDEDRSFLETPGSRQFPVIELPTHDRLSQDVISFSPGQQETNWYFKSTDCKSKHSSLCSDLVAQGSALLASTGKFCFPSEKSLLQIRDYATVFGELSQVSNELSMLRIALRREQEAHETAKKELQGTQDALLALEGESLEKDLKVAELEENVQLLQTRLKRPEDIEGLRGKSLDYARAEIQQLKSYLAGRDRKIANLRHALSQSSVAENTTAREREIEDLALQLSKLKILNSGLNKKVEELQCQTKHLRGNHSLTVKKHEEEVNRLCKQPGEKTGMGTEFSELQEKLSEWKTQGKTQTSEGTIENYKAKLENSSLEANKKLRKLENELEQHRVLKTQQELEIDTLRETARQAECLAKQYRTQLEVTREAREEDERIEAISQQCQAQIQDLQDSLLSVQSSLTEQNSQLKDELNERDEEIEFLNVQMTEFEEVNAALYHEYKGQLKALASKYEEAVQKPLDKELQQCETQTTQDTEGTTIEELQQTIDTMTQESQLQLQEHSQQLNELNGELSKANEELTQQQLGKLRKQQELELAAKDRLLLQKLREKEKTLNQRHKEATEQLQEDFEERLSAEKQNLKQLLFNNEEARKNCSQRDFEQTLQDKEKQFESALEQQKQLARTQFERELLARDRELESLKTEQKRLQAEAAEEAKAKLSVLKQELLKQKRVWERERRILKEELELAVEATKRELEAAATEKLTAERRETERRHRQKLAICQNKHSKELKDKEVFLALEFEKEKDNALRSQAETLKTRFLREKEQYQGLSDSQAEQLQEAHSKVLAQLRTQSQLGIRRIEELKERRSTDAKPLQIVRSEPDSVHIAPTAELAQCVARALEDPASPQNSTLCPVLCAVLQRFSQKTAERARSLENEVLFYREQLKAIEKPCDGSEFIEYSSSTYIGLSTVLRDLQRLFPECPRPSLPTREDYCAALSLLEATGRQLESFEDQLRSLTSDYKSYVLRTKEWVQCAEQEKQEWDTLKRRLLTGNSQLQVEVGSSRERHSQEKSSFSRELANLQRENSSLSQEAACSQREVASLKSSISALSQRMSEIEELPSLCPEMLSPEETSGLIIGIFKRSSHENLVLSALHKHPEFLSLLQEFLATSAELLADSRLS